MISIYSKLNCKGNLCDSEYTDKNVFIPHALMASIMK